VPSTESIEDITARPGKKCAIENKKDRPALFVQLFATAID